MPELQDGILRSLLDETVIPTSTALPAGFVAKYELIGIVSHMVAFRPDVNVGRLSEGRTLCRVGETEREMVQM